LLSRKFTIIFTFSHDFAQMRDILGILKSNRSFARLITSPLQPLEKLAASANAIVAAGPAAFAATLSQTCWIRAGAAAFAVGQLKIKLSQFQQVLLAPRG
jgi:hypothetical protein